MKLMMIFFAKGGNYSGGSVQFILVDMILLPPNNTFQAHILAIDAIGNVIYCAPGQNPIVQWLPGSSAGITRIAYESNTLYVLNPEVGTVLVYQPTNGQYSDPPTDYFEDSRTKTGPEPGNGYGCKRRETLSASDRWLTCGVHVQQLCWGCEVVNPVLPRLTD